MKPLLTILFVAVAAAAVFFAAHLAGGPQKKTATNLPSPSPQTVANSPPSVAPAIRSPQQKAVRRSVLPPDEQAAALAQGELISGLFDAGADGSKDNLETVYTALNHHEREVREAAVDVVIQHIGRDGIPRLRAALASAPTREDQQQIEEAIEFLELPTLQEVSSAPPAAPPSSPAADPTRAPAKQRPFGKGPSVEP
jgi:hypothetical protein